MKKILNSILLTQVIFVLTFFPFTNLSAQGKAPKVIYKEGSDVDSDLQGNDEIFSDPDGTVYLAGGGTDCKSKKVFGQNMIEKISPDLKTVTTGYIYLAIPDENELIPAYKFLYLNGKLFAFANSTDYDIKLLYAIEVDKSTLKIIGKPINIFKYVVNDGYGISIIASKNEEQMMIIRFEGSGGNGIDHIRIKVFEGNLETSWESKVSAPTGTTAFSLTDLRLYDDGTLLMIGYDKYDADFAKKALKEGKPDYMDHIITLAEHSETIVDRKIDVGDVFTKSIQAEILPNGNIVASGFYSDFPDDVNRSERLTDGIFYASFEKDKSTPSLVKTTKFSAEFIGDQMDEGFIHSNKKIDRLKNAYVRQMFARNDGSITLLGEHIAIIPRGSSANVYFLEALVISVSATGDITWAKRIYKDQEQRNVYSLDFTMTREYSFYSSVLNDQLLIFFNDDIDSKSTENSDEPEVYNGEDDCDLICVSVTANGDITKQAVHEFDKTKTSPCVCMFHQTGKADFIYFGWGHNISDNVNSIHVGN